MSSFYTAEELCKIGLKQVGENVNISKKASLYSPQKMIFGDNVRVDDFCILSGEINIGSNVHISAGVYLYGNDSPIIIRDHCGISGRSIVYGSSDDFSGKHMIGPMIENNFRNVIKGKVILEKFVQIGAGCIILPGITIGEGSVTGAMTLVNKDLKPWSVYVGSPAKFLKNREKDIIDIAKKLHL